MNFGKEKREYYVLKPVYDENPTIYAPTDNETVTQKMRRVLTKDEIDSLIESLENNDTKWSNNDIEKRVLRIGYRKRRQKKVNASG